MADAVVVERSRPEVGPEPGSEGSLRLVVDRVAGRTRIVDLECSGPIQVLRCQYLDAGAPDVASVMIASPSGGVLQGDRLRMTVDVRAGARLVLETQSAGRLYRMPRRQARIESQFSVGRDGWLEFVPDPYIPFAGSDTTIQSVITLEETAGAIIGEVVAAGRVARGEVYQMTRFESTTSTFRPSGSLLFSDATLLEAGDRLRDQGMMGAASALGTLYVLAPDADPETLRAAIRACAPSSARAGASTLPNEVGSWLRVVATDTAGAVAVVAAGRDAARIGLLGTASPPSRRP